MTYLERRVLRKSVNNVADYMNNLGFNSCITCNGKITFCNNPMRNDITVIFSEKGRAKQVIYEEIKR